MYKVKCPICGVMFAREETEYIQDPKSKRYFHKNCYDNYKKEADEKTELVDYICKLFGYIAPGPVIYKQLKYYRDELQYSNDGILKALKYHYEVKKGDLGKANGAVGIVPFIYDDAQIYFEDLKKKSESIADSVKPVESRVVQIHIKPKQDRSNAIDLSSLV